ncbi:uncharacterized protein LOC143039438 [Oratosquilla oratoria]|uniref:uncharacterized protein LOC143039438 n=1 Tax=Oratosquilla oratoria TaxID=337810 RepID=UPI003F757C88
MNFVTVQAFLLAVVLGILVAVAESRSPYREAYPVRRRSPAAIPRPAFGYSGNDNNLDDFLEQRPIVFPITTNEGNRFNYNYPSIYPRPLPSHPLKMPSYYRPRPSRW